MYAGHSTNGRCGGGSGDRGGTAPDSNDRWPNLLKCMLVLSHATRTMDRNRTRVSNMVDAKVSFYLS